MEGGRNQLVRTSKFYLNEEEDGAQLPPSNRNYAARSWKAKICFELKFCCFICNKRSFVFPFFPLFFRSRFMLSRSMIRFYVKQVLFRFWARFYCQTTGWLMTEDARDSKELKNFRIKFRFVNRNHAITSQLWFHHDSPCHEINSWRLTGKRKTIEKKFFSVPKMKFMNQASNY